jgi:hypothetical protein
VLLVVNSAPAGFGFWRCDHALIALGDTNADDGIKSTELFHRTLVMAAVRSGDEFAYETNDTMANDAQDRATALVNGVTQAKG